MLSFSLKSMWSAHQSKYGKYLVFEKKAFHHLHQLIMPGELKKHSFFSSCRDTTEDHKHSTFISDHKGLLRQVIHNGIFFINYVKGVIGASWKAQRALAFEAVNNV